ncbi:LysR family transcriptional regulator [Janthinobacterium aquaticum]|uniref:LysR family transcriptional regulator n=1 Tax=Janthinobacterium sp. FT58W TaxID=2654254 RepID=UPI001264B302|nr:LysR family transcriptional regulator [Janthinobacterium sp. FT58W]KAB8044291.1 LysR family transcriptional regulator [Janthinobacterium sp. FT58W]
MDNLNAIAAFVRAAETCSFVAAGRLLGVSASAVGKSVARLEHKLGVRLLNRSTRRISLSNEGALFYERCQRILADLDDAELELSHLAQAPRGKLKVSLPVIGYRMIVPLLAEFAQRYPEIELDLDFSDRLVDVVAEGVDVAVRSGELVDSRLMARELGPFGFVIVGSPVYLARHGVPQVPRDLEQHGCVRYKFPSTGKLQQWAIERDHVEGELLLRTALTCNNIEALIGAASQGLGLAYLPDFLVREAIASGKLRSVLGSYLQTTSKFWVLWPSSRHLSPKLRVFVDFLHEHLRFLRV